MVGMALPPGFRFHPTDDELVNYYLKRKVDGLTIELEVIPVVDLYKFDPWELPDKSFLPKTDMEWFFFCSRDRKFPNGSRTNRATRSGYWKATGKDRKIVCEPPVYGLRKTLVFYRGRAPGGERTDWMMHEYRLCEDYPQGSPNFVGAFALCRVVKRKEHAQKIDDLQGEPKSKRSNTGPRKYLNNASSSLVEKPYQANKIFERGNYSTASENHEAAEMEPTATDTGRTSFLGPNVISDASKAFQLKDDRSSGSVLPADLSNSTNVYTPCDISPVSSYSNLAADDYFGDELGGSAYLPSFPSPVHCMGLYSNGENMDPHSFEWDLPQFIHPPTNGTESWNTMMPMICRQASEGEEANLWLHEDNLVIMT